MKTRANVPGAHAQPAATGPSRLGVAPVQAVSIGRDREIRFDVQVVRGGMGHEAEPTWSKRSEALAAWLIEQWERRDSRETAP